MRDRAGHSREAHRCLPRLVSSTLVTRSSPRARASSTASSCRADPRTETHRWSPTASERHAGHSAPPRDTGGHPRLVGAALALALRHTDGRPRLVSAMLVTQPCDYPPSHPKGTEGGAHLYGSLRRHTLAAQASTRAYLALTFENVSVFHAHAFNIALLLAVDPPYRSRGSDETGRPVGGSCTMASPVPWCLPRRPRYLRAQKGGRQPATP